MLAQIIDQIDMSSIKVCDIYSIHTFVLVRSLNEYGLDLRFLHHYILHIYGRILAVRLNVLRLRVSCFDRKNTDILVFVDLSSKRVHFVDI